MPDNIEISGGASDEVAAAIAALVGAIASEEKAALATQRRPIHRSQWIEASRPLERMAPIPPAEYKNRPGQGPDDTSAAPA
ncbi:MAG: hypothetical protein ACR2N2_10700 [Acidimicrobiia bacterium]